MSPPIHQDILTEKLKKYRYFSNEKHICIPIEQFELLFVHCYGGFLSDWEIRIGQNDIGKEELRLKNISGFEYRFPLVLDNRV
jgi:hypothetical protein